MATGIFDDLRQTASKLGSCDPLWLKHEQEPDFQIVEGGTTGPHIILLHGLLGALSNWDSLFPIIEKFSRPLGLHLPILTAHRSEVRVKALTVFTEYLIRKRRLDPVILCGNSLGGHIALRLALASPELVDCLILSGASGLYEHSVDSLPVRPTPQYIREHMARVFHDRKFITEEAVDEIHQILSKRMNVLNLINAARSAKKDNLLSVLNQIKVPTLLLWGEDDEVTTMQVANTFHKNIPNSKLVSIKNCGHAPMIEHPEWFAKEMEAFLKEHSIYYKNQSKQ
ncbi:MAG: alpha/beta hydrolase [Deltaproteobacteria bacterium]|nr:alpha/beta hydrolase [Deltaproteobacteria bacterium]